MSLARYLRTSLIAPLIVVAAVGAVGAFVLLHSHAATPTGAIEAEQGTLTGSASLVADSSASSNKAVRFSRASTSLSGLPWLSGTVSGEQDGWTTFRGRQSDVVTTWEDDGSWGGTENVWDLFTGKLANFKGRLAIGIPMLSNTSDTFAACASGAYDSHFTALGNTLKHYGRDNSFVRLGWEGNGTWYAWSVGNDPTGWVNCFHREVTALRAADPNVVIDWNMNKDASIDARTMYPGDSYVDVIGVDFYDMYPHYNTQADWDNGYMATNNGSPKGLGSWLAFAKLHGKKLSVPEWGVNNGGGDGGTDNPLYIQNMYNFFSSNAGSIAYESYFNTQCPNFCLNPAGKNPLAAAAYAARW